MHRKKIISALIFALFTLSFGIMPTSLRAAPLAAMKPIPPQLQSFEGEAKSAIGKLLWSDEFSGKNGSQPDSASWSSNVGNYVSNSITTRSPQLSTLDGSKSGLLKIVTKKINDPSLYHGICGGGKLCHFQSGMVSTRNRVTFQTGYIEARIKMPTGEGNWPALWFLRDGNYDPANPKPGEIDLVEWYGNYPTKGWSTLHFPEVKDGVSGKLMKAQTGAITFSESLSAGFHTYGMSWLPNSITFFLDGKPFKRFTSETITTWPFNNPFYLILNGGVGPQPNSIYGGTWSGWQQSTMSIDWVRVWQIDGYGQVKKRTVAPMTPEEMIALLK